jgi:Domain of unknown function DUF11
MTSKILKQFSIALIALTIGIGALIIYPRSSSLKYGFDKPALNTMYENQQCSIPFKQGDWTDYCNIKKFNPTDGILKNIKITLQSSTKSEVYLENLNLIPGSFDVSSVTDILISDSNNNELVTNQITATKNYSLDKYDGIKDYAGNSGVADMNLKGALSERTNVFGDKARMLGFVKNDANDSVSKSIIIKSQGKVSSTNNMEAKVLTQTEVNVIKFQYEYVVGDLTISKFHEPKILEKNKISQIKIQATNNDTDQTEGTITVKDNLPAYLEYISQDNADWICSNVNGVVCTTSKSLAPNESSYIVINVKVLDSAPNSYVNTATISYSQKEYNYDNNTTTDTIEFGIAPKNPTAYDCDLGFSGINESFYLDARISDCLKGTDPDGDVTVVKFMVKTLPDPKTGKLQYEGKDIDLNFVVTQGNQNKLQFVPTKDYCGKYNFTYTAIDEINLDDSTPATVIGEIKCATPQAPVLDDLEIIKYTEGKFIENIWAKYIIRVKNTKNTDFKGKFTVKDALPKGVPIVKITIGNGWDCSKSLTQVLDCTYTGSLVGKQEEFVTIDVMPQTNTIGLITNTAFVVTDNQEDNLNNNQASVESYITQQVIPAQTPAPKPIADNQPVEIENEDEEAAQEVLTRTGGYSIASFAGLTIIIIATMILVLGKNKKTK